MASRATLLFKDTRITRKSQVAAGILTTSSPWAQIHRLSRRRVVLDTSFLSCGVINIDRPSLLIVGFLSDLRLWNHHIRRCIQISS